MQRSVWLGVAVALTGLAVGCSDGDDDLSFSTGGRAAAGTPGSAGGPVASGGSSAGVGNASGGARAGSASGGSSALGGNASGGSAVNAGNAGNSSGGSGTTAGNASGGSAGSGGAVPPGGSGGRIGSGGRGFGGRSSGGRGSTGGATSATGGTPATPAECSLMVSGATGDEAGGEIPVCCAPSLEEKTQIEEVFALLNEHRMANGLSALAYDSELEAAIQGHCVHMSQHSFFAHEAEESAVASPWDRAELCGTSAAGENIAQGQRSPAAVMQDWTESDGHNDNMLGERFTRVGIGYAADGRYWGQIFGQ
jgi:uncharacterized protein YkwD